MADAVLLGAASMVSTEVPTPSRPVTYPKSVSSPVNPAAWPVPLDDLGYSRGVLSSAWSADGRQLFL